eukprot:gene2181-2477_t
MEQIKRKVNYHVDKYKEVCDWNRNQSGGNRREGDFFDIIDTVLGTKDIVQFTDILGAGFESQDTSTGVEGNVDMDIETTIAIPGSSSTPKTFQVISQTLEDRDSAADDDTNNNDDNHAVTEINLTISEKEGEEKGKEQKEDCKGARSRENECTNGGNVKSGT